MMYSHQRTPSNVSYHSSIPVHGHGVYTRPTALLPKTPVKNYIDISSSRVFADPNNSTPLIGYRPSENNWVDLSQTNLKRTMMVEVQNPQHMLTPTVSKIKYPDNSNTRTAYKTEPTERTDVFSAKASRMSGGITVEEQLRMENSHLKTEN